MSVTFPYAGKGGRDGRRVSYFGGDGFWFWPTRNYRKALRLETFLCAERKEGGREGGREGGTMQWLSRREGGREGGREGRNRKLHVPVSKPNHRQARRGEKRP